MTPGPAPVVPAPAVPAAGRLLGVPLLVRLRQATLLAVAALVVATGLGWGPAWSVAWPLGALAVGLVTTAALAWREARGGAPDGWVAAVLFADVATLTVLFGQSGGSANPFALLFLFPLVLGAFTLGAGWTWAVFAATAAGYGSLFLLAPTELHHHGPEAMRSHVLGMFAAYLCTGAMMAVAVGRVRSSRVEADARLAAARELEERTRRLASLATLAAGAAHELATPLSTILVVSRELERRVDDPRARDDLELVREEVLRCQGVLTQLSADVGAGTGEPPQALTVAELLEEALEPPGGGPVEVEADDAVVRVPVGLVGQVVRRLVGNARDASPPGGRVRVRGQVRDGALEIAVTDEGAGMTPEVLQRATEPFFTTKPEGQGKGLGLYFSRSVAAQLHGELRIESTPGRGTTATLVLPPSPPPSPPPEAP